MVVIIVRDVVDEERLTLVPWHATMRCQRTTRFVMARDYWHAARHSARLMLLWINTRVVIGLRGCVRFSLSQTFGRRFNIFFTLELLLALFNHTKALGVLEGRHWRHIFFRLHTNRLLRLALGSRFKFLIGTDTSRECLWGLASLHSTALRLILLL